MSRTSMDNNSPELKCVMSVKLCEPAKTTGKKSTKRIVPVGYLLLLWVSELVAYYCYTGIRTRTSRLVQVFLSHFNFNLQ